MSHPVLSPYALCEMEDVKDSLGYDDDNTSRDRTIINNINAASRIIARAAQRDFILFPNADTPGTGTRTVCLSAADVSTRTIRLGDIQAVPDSIIEVAILSPNRDEEIILETTDYFPVPDSPEVGLPYTALQIKSNIETDLSVGWWVRVEALWGFEAIPDDIRMVAAVTAGAWILSDILKRTELGDGVGQLRLPRAIPSELEEIVWSYRTYRVA